MTAATIFLGGDVMTGRGIDQILPAPGPPLLREPSVHDARAYVELAEAANGGIPRPVDHGWPWGDALAVLDGLAPDLRLLNLETSITRSDGYSHEKSVHYRMHPDNIPCLTITRPDACVLANNHVLDFGVAGLAETLDTLAAAGLCAVGAGRDEDEAWRPARLSANGRRVLVFSVAAQSSGAPPGWAADGGRAGIALLAQEPDAAAAAINDRVGRHRRPGDLVVVSIHWGSNWGYDVSPGDVQLAHRLVDAGVDIVHGHSSHHPRPIEVYHGRLVLYGCGDLINDYEGISGYQEYRDDLRLLYFADLDLGTGALRTLRMVPVRSVQLRLRRAGPSDSNWLCDTLNRISGPFGSRVELDPDDTLVLQPN
jgi:poly-gamma-glutamate capsule biosynthesis protein CapA/YwtB (metallophosphatase superfamily)